MITAKQPQWILVDPMVSVCCTTCTSCCIPSLPFNDSSGATSACLAGIHMTLSKSSQARHLLMQHMAVLRLKLRCDTRRKQDISSTSFVLLHKPGKTSVAFETPSAHGKHIACWRSLTSIMRCRSVPARRRISFMCHAGTISGDAQPQPACCPTKHWSSPRQPSARSCRTCFAAASKPSAACLRGPSHRTPPSSHGLRAVKAQSGAGDQTRSASLTMPSSWR